MSGRKFTIDLGANAIAFGLAAVAGVLINLVIIRHYDASALGVFNLVYAAYILLSQLAVGGVHLAVQAMVPERVAKRLPVHSVVTSAMIISTVSSVIVMTAAWYFRDLPGRWFDSPVVGEAFGKVVLGLLFFSWNKVLLSFHNGARRMKLFALFQFLRPAIMLGLIILLAFRDAEPQELPAVLAYTEMILFTILFPVSMGWWHPWHAEELFVSLIRTFRFGNKALPGNLLLDVNTRVDVVMLGLFTTDAQVGLYSFAATVAEGLVQLPVLFRNNINPVIAHAYAKGGPGTLERIIARNRRVFFKILAPLALISIPLFPLGLWVLGMNDSPRTVWAVYAILALGIAASSGHLPFQMLFSQLGAPGTQTLFIGLVFLSNVILNLLLIPMAGIYGAALATSLSFIALAIILHRLAFRTFAIRL
ncbi:MAG: polysaccharide biosynthesis C-terminal domain-containing protein [Flavobacteriales bacterium]|nr:polysaccharide biosynthesis C-terminal domain-containing protein [Flavobacteriales bacterium]